MSIKDQEHTWLTMIVDDVKAKSRDNCNIFNLIFVSE